MKKNIIFSLSIFILISLSLPTESQAQSFEKGTISVSPGINLGGLGFYGSGSGIPLVASGEYGIHEYIGVGPFVGFANYKFGSGTGAYKYRIITAGVRGDFHYASLLEELLEMDMNSDKLDLYIAVLVGYQTTAYSGPDGTTFGSGLYGNRANSGVALGGRFYISDNFAVYAEAGRILYGALNIGITLRLK